MSKILVVGAGGRLGAALVREWALAGETVEGMDRRALPLNELEAIEGRLWAVDFNVLVNCAALTNVDYCEGHRDEAFLLNATAPERLAQICEKRGARCIHISTDYVFDGAAKRPYTESDAASPISVYGESKLAGERAVLAMSPRNWSVRVSWVFGPDRASFVDQVVARALKEEVVEAVADKWATPTYTVDAARLLRPFLAGLNGGGVLHLSNGGVCSWQEYGQWALDCAVEAGLPLKARRVGALAMADLKAFVAKRPPFSAMNTSKLRGLTGQEVRGWKEAVREYVLGQAERGAWGALGSVE